MRRQLFLLCSDLQIVFLPEGVPPPVSLQPGKIEVLLSFRYLQIFDERDDGFVAELSLVVPAVGDHLFLCLGLQTDFLQYGHPVLVSLAQQIVEENLRKYSNVRLRFHYVWKITHTLGVRL